MKKGEIKIFRTLGELQAYSEKHNIKENQYKVNIDNGFKITKL